VRRSSRRNSAKPITYKEKESDVEDGEENPANTGMNSDDVKQAISDLVEMDKSLCTYTKRQKLAAEQSNRTQQRGDGHGMGNPESSTVDVRIRDTRSRQRKRPALLPTPEKDSEPDTIKTEEDAEYVPAIPLGTKVEAKQEPEDVEESVERAAARPPAVNSSYLPLPWKGRLGYVSSCSSLGVSPSSQVRRYIIRC
jgi:UV DNA damage endonuclease